MTSKYAVGDLIFIDLECNNTKNTYGFTSEMENLQGSQQRIDNIQYDNISKCYKYSVSKYFWVETDLLKKSPLDNIKYNGFSNKHSFDEQELI